eukprot:SAG22_NODE_3367_length_1755_cov_42.324164_3_plen_151_part_00
MHELARLWSQGAVRSRQLAEGILSRACVLVASGTAESIEAILPADFPANCIASEASASLLGAYWRVQPGEFDREVLAAASMQEPAERAVLDSRVRALLRAVKTDSLLRFHAQRLLAIALRAAAAGSEGCERRTFPLARELGIAIRAANSV